MRFNWKYWLSSHLMQNSNGILKWKSNLIIPLNTNTHTHTHTHKFSTQPVSVSTTNNLPNATYSLALKCSTIGMRITVTTLRHRSLLIHIQPSDIF
jgi:hypothetical protein